MYGIFYPPRCAGSNCFRPLVGPDDRVDLRAWIGAEPVWNATNVSSSEPLFGRLTVPVPTEIRQGYHAELQLRVTLSRAGEEPPLATAVADLVRRMPPRVRAASMLLEEDTTDAAARHDPFAGLAPPDSQGRVPHFIYSSTPLILRVTNDETPHAGTRMPSGDPIGSAVDHQRRRYAPFFYACTFSLLRRHAAPLSSN
eukprot:5597093-Prymnesium_polylepis.1